MRPFGDQTGAKLGSDASINCFWSLPSAFIVQISPPRLKTIRVPSGENLGWVPDLASTLESVPSALTSLTPGTNPGSPVPVSKTIVRPSGDQLGLLPAVRTRRPPPLALTV